MPKVPQRERWNMNSAHYHLFILVAVVVMAVCTYQLVVIQ